MNNMLNKNCTNKEYADFAVYCNENRLHIEQTETDYYALESYQTLKNGKITDLRNNTEWQESQAQKRQEWFNKAFFNTSLGYIRRSVSMATGETKDFLSALFPAISVGVSAGKQVPIIVYTEPDFTQELTTEYMISLQSNVYANAQFIEDCLNQIAIDMYGGI